MAIFISKHIFSGNRAYFSPKLEKSEDVKKKVFDQKKELSGAGFRSYGDFAGFILSCIGFATKLKFGNQELYVNNKSFCKFAIRRSEMVALGKKQVPSDVKKLDELYHTHKKNGYDKKEVARMENRLKAIAKDYDYDYQQLVDAVVSKEELK